MKAKYKIGMLLSYKDQSGTETYGTIRAVVNHHDHAEYMLESGAHIGESDILTAFTPLKKKAATKRKPKVVAKEDTRATGTVM